MKGLRSESDRSSPRTKQKHPKQRFGFGCFCFGVTVITLGLILAARESRDQHQSWRLLQADTTRYLTLLTAQGWLGFKPD